MGSGDAGPPAPPPMQRSMVDILLGVRDGLEHVKECGGGSATAEIPQNAAATAATSGAPKQQDPGREAREARPAKLGDNASPPLLGEVMVGVEGPGNRAVELKKPLGSVLRAGREEKSSEQRQRFLETLAGSVRIEGFGSKYGGSASARMPAGRTGPVPEPAHVIHRHHHHHWHHHYFNDQEAEGHGVDGQLLEDFSEVALGGVQTGAVGVSGGGCGPGGTLADEPEHQHVHIHRHTGEVEIPPRAQRLLIDARRAGSAGGGGLRHAGNNSANCAGKRSSQLASQRAAALAACQPDTRLPRLS